MARSGSALFGVTRRGMAGVERFGWLGRDGFGSADMARRSLVWRGGEWRGSAGHKRSGAAVQA
jgi:hypothetical protein